MVEAAPEVGVAEQKLPNPWVGQTIASAGSSAASRAVLGPGQLEAVLASEQVGPPGRPVEERPSREDRDDSPRMLDRVGQVVERMSWRGDDQYPQLASLDLIPVADTDPVEGDPVRRAHVVGGPHRAGEGEAARDVVVVDVSLEPVGDPDYTALRHRQDSVDVTLRVDHDRHRAIG